MIKRGVIIKMEAEKGYLELIASSTFPINNELVKVVDFLNRTLKSKNIMFGISKDKEGNRMVINIYEYE